MTKSKARLVVGAALLVIATPLLLIAAILLEVAIFHTRHINNAAESIGLTPYLQMVFSTLGING